MAQEDTQKRRAQVSTSASWLSGSMSGLSAAVVLQPLDVARTEMQKQKHGGNLRTRRAVAMIAQKDGVTALWRGLSPTIARVGFGTGMYFSLLNAMTIAWSKDEGVEGKGPKLSGSNAFVAGFTARGIASVTLLPLTVVKTRFEAGQRPHGNMFRTLVCIAQQERLRGLFSGLTPTLLRDAPFSGVYYYSYMKLKALFAGQGWHSVPVQAQHFGAGVCAGAAASLLTNPFDVVRTRMQLSPGGGAAGSYATAMGIWAKEGWRSLAFGGLMPRVYKKSLAAAISWTVYEEGVRAFGRLQEKLASPNKDFGGHTRTAAKL